DVAQDPGTIRLASLRTSEYGTQHAPDIHPRVILLQRTRECLRALRPAGVAAQGAEDPGQCRADRGRGLLRADAQLPGELAGGPALELGGKVVGEHRHGGAPVVGWATMVRRSRRLPRAGRGTADQVTGLA